MAWAWRALDNSAWEVAGRQLRTVRRYPDIGHRTDENKEIAQPDPPEGVALLEDRNGKNFDTDM